MLAPCSPGWRLTAAALIALALWLGVANPATLSKAAAQLPQETAFADPQDFISLTGNKPRDIEAGEISAYLDPGRSQTIEDILARGHQLFGPLPARRIDFDYTKAQIWLRIPVRNSSVAPIEPVMVLHARFMHHLEAYRLNAAGGAPGEILRNSASQPFGERKIPYRHLAAPLPLEPGEATIIYIGYWSDGASEMPISFETPASFEKLSARADIFNAAIYAACLAMVAFTLMATAVMRWRVHVTYALYFVCVVLFLAHMEGYTFRYLWPDWPRFNAYGSLSIGYALSFFAILFTREFLKLRNHAPFLDRVGIGIMITTLLVVLLGSLGDTQFIKRFGFVFNFGTTVFLIASAVVSIRHRQPGAVYYLVGWSAIFIATLLSAITHWIEDVFALSMTSNFISIAVLFEAMIFTLAISAQVRVLRQDKVQAMAERLAATEENLRLVRERADAMAEAEARRTQLASASHDAKQPLMALRLALEGETGKGEQGRKLREILSYLDSLIGRQLSETSPDRTISPDTVATPQPCDAKKMVARLDDMFRAEAEAKGLRFISRARPAQGACDPMPVLRILSNLLANAIQHTSTGSVGVVAHSTDAAVHFEIFDTGPGMNEEELEAAREAYAKGPESHGHGLGLMIAYEIAGAYGLDLSANPRSRGGLRFTLCVPLRKPAHQKRGDHPVGAASLPA